MIQETCRVTSVTLKTEEIFVVTFDSPRIAESVLPGQFVNIRAWIGSDPLLRRPFSVYRVDGGSVSIVFNIVGKGTRLLSELHAGDLVDVIGPLGIPFARERHGYDLACLVGGGLGVAPLPILTAYLRTLKKEVVTYLGARTKRFLIEQYLENVSLATDDGTAGFHGTVVDLVARDLPRWEGRKIRFFGCGPNPMLRALGMLAVSRNIPCEISLEGPMGCGFGICQGCPVPRSGEEGGFFLMCREGPVFDPREVKV